MAYGLFYGTIVFLIPPYIAQFMGCIIGTIGRFLI